MRARGWGIAAIVWLCACTITTVQRDHSERVSIPAGSGRISGDLGLDLGVDLGTDAITERDIQGASLSTLSITTNTPGADISFLERVEVYVEAKGMPRVLIASGSDFPAGTTTVQLDLPDEELSDYLLADNVHVYTIVTGTMPDVDVDVYEHVVMDIGVTPEGACNALELAGQTPEPTTAGPAA
jgi:hypothetical protein